MPAAKPAGVTAWTNYMRKRGYKWQLRWREKEPLVYEHESGLVVSIRIKGEELISHAINGDEWRNAAPDRPMSLLLAYCHEARDMYFYFRRKKAHDERRAKKMAD